MKSLFSSLFSRSFLCGSFLFSSFFCGSLFDDFLDLFGSFFDRSFLFFGLKDVGQVLILIEESTDGKADAFLVVVDVSDLTFDYLALLQDIVRFLDALVGDLRNVDEAVDAGDDVGKRTECGHTDDGGVDNVADFIGLGKNDPGVVLVLLVAKRNTIVLEGLDVNFDRVADVQNQESSEMWIMPSMPPMSTNAP